MGGWNVPVERDSDIARVDWPKNKTQIRHQCPKKESPHATFSAEKVFDALTGSNGRDSRDNTGENAPNGDTCYV